MARVCDLCKGKCNIFTSFSLGDGIYCMKCEQKLNVLGLDYKNTWDPEKFFAFEVRNILNNPETSIDKIKTICDEYAKLKAQNENCLICGKAFKTMSGKYETSDGRVLCVRCKNAAITISPQDFLDRKDRYIASKKSDFFLANLKDVEIPHIALVINYTTRMIYYGGEWNDTLDSVFSFDSVVKFESDVDTYEVTVGKSGHPIARAVVGGALFGSTGAILGAVTAKNTRHTEQRKGKPYINIYHKGTTNPQDIHKRVLYAEDDTEIVKIEECLKRAFLVKNEVVEEDKVIESIEEKKEHINNNNNNYGELIELKNLLDMGIISQEEFDAKKKQILQL